MTETSAPSPKYRIEQLDKKHNKNLFSCGTEALDQYLKIQASQDSNKMLQLDMY